MSINGFLMFLAGIVLVVISDRIKNSINKLIDYILDKLNLKYTLYKKRTRELYHVLEKITGDELCSDKMPKFIFETWNEHEKIPFNWKIIKVDKNVDTERIDKSIILQLPASSKYKVERNMMRPEYKMAFFLSLAKKLALETKKEDVIDCIDNKVEKCGCLREFQIMNEILASKEKFSSMIIEARRKWVFLKGDISSTAKREFRKYIDDLSKGDVGVLSIWDYKPAKAYFIDVKSNLAAHNILHIYARGTSIDSGNLRAIDDLLKLIKKKMKKIKIEDEGLYNWTDSSESIVYKARTIVLKRK